MELMTPFLIYFKENKWTGNGEDFVIEKNR